MAAAGRHICLRVLDQAEGVNSLGFFNGMSKMTMHTKIKYILFSLSYFVILFFAANSYSQTDPNCGSANFMWSGGASACSSPNAYSQAQSQCYTAPDRCMKVTNTDQCGVRQWACYGNTPSCPSGSTFNDSTKKCEETCSPPQVLFDGVCQLPVVSPQECESEVIGVTAYQVPSGGYLCMPGADYPCGEGMTPGTVAGSNSIISICDQPTGSSSSSNSSESSTSSSAGSSDGGGGSSDGSGGDGSSSTGSSESSSSSSESSSSGGGDSSSSGGGSSSSGGGGSSSAGAGDCDPTATNYSLCVGTIEEIDDNKADQIIAEFEQGVGDELNDVYGDLEGDIQDFVSIDNEFKEAPSDLSDAIKAFLPSSASCTSFQFTLLGETKEMSCQTFEDFKLIFGWFLTIMAAIHIWSFSTKPVER